MLNKLDDFPIHQTPEPIAHPATSDRNVYDRTWFNGYAPDGSYYFGIGMAVYPQRKRDHLRSNFFRANCVNTGSSSDLVAGN